MQTILGAGGPIGTELARALRKYTSEIRVVSRKPEKVHPEDELFPADLRKWPEVKEAVRGSEVVYLTAGLPYKFRRWKKDWPLIVSNVIKACQKFDTKLVFFDNAYMYSSKSMGHMTENSTVDPPSKKGRIRAEIAEMIMKEVWTEKLQALIARSADFYGPGIKSNSLLIETVFKPIWKNKRAMWLGDANCKHSFTFTPDAGKATAFLGNTEAAYGQVWHLPTAHNTLTGKQWIKCIGKEMNAKTDYWEVPKWMVRLLGVFMPVMRETVEMMYQYNHNYVFDSRKIEEQFGLEPTSYQSGIREVVKKDFSK
jgi:nucleoside-diphosphate-sugar epimerase